MARKDSKLRRLIESIAEQDCQTEEDIAMGLCNAIQEHIPFPISGKVIGEWVTVMGVEEGPELDVIAVCERKGRMHKVRLQDVEIKAGEKGGEWVEAYKLFRTRGEPQEAALNR
jgi:hypothetical protein